MKEVTKQKNIRIIKINTCKSLSGKSTLEYQIGCLDKDIYIRVVKNSSSGWFAKEWVSIQKIITVLESSNLPLTSFTLQPFFTGKSVNTAAFIFAAIKEENLVATNPDNPRCYLLQSVESFMQPINVLVSSNVALQDTLVKSIKTKAVNLDDDIPVLASSSKPASGKTKQAKEV